MELIDLASWAKESKRRGETIDTYLVKEGGKTQEVIQIAINPHFLAGLLQKGKLTKYRLLKNG